MSMELSENNYSVRELLLTDKDSVLAIWSEGRSFLRESGVSQWQKGDYPGEEAFFEDLKEKRGRVVINSDRVVGVFAFTLTSEPSYSTLNGLWDTNEGEYLTIHRSAVKRDEMGKGIMSLILSYSISEAKRNNKKSVRIDTHKDNGAMIRALRKNGFEEKGSIILLSGSEKGDGRLGFEKCIN